MKANNAVIVLLVMLVAGVWILVFQSVRLIGSSDHPLPIAVSGKLDTSGSKIDTSGSTVLVGGRVDANLSAVVGYPLVTSQGGMYIGVASQMGTVIPIYWGKMSLEETAQPVDVRITSVEPVNVNISAFAGEKFNDLSHLLQGRKAALPVKVVP